ncbi:hypothetical protein TcBrA4_0108120 [Trypanosoma cruzi]|nr:hypothetical protein TcBrA4_0108120 [Trypanosoma cruzi]
MMMTCRLLCALLVLALCCCPSVCVTEEALASSQTTTTTTTTKPPTSRPVDTRESVGGSSALWKGVILGNGQPGSSSNGSAAEAGK